MIPCRLCPALPQGQPRPLLDSPPRLALGSDPTKTYLPDILILPCPDSPPRIQPQRHPAPTPKTHLPHDQPTTYHPVLTLSNPPPMIPPQKHSQAGTSCQGHPQDIPRFSSPNLTLVIYCFWYKPPPSFPMALSPQCTPSLCLSRTPAHLHDCSSPRNPHQLLQPSSPEPLHECSNP